MPAYYIDPESPFLREPAPASYADRGHGERDSPFCRRHTAGWLRPAPVLAWLRRHQTLIAMIGCLVVYHHTFAPPPAVSGSVYVADAKPTPPPIAILAWLRRPELNSVDAKTKSTAQAASVSAAGSERQTTPRDPEQPEAKGESDEAEGQGWLQPDVASAHFEVYAVRVSSPHRVLGRGVVLFVTPTVPGLVPLPNMTHHTAEPHGLPNVHHYLRATTPVLGDYIDGS